MKRTPEDLSALLLNFDEVNATLGGWPCLRAMLRSTAPERLPACALDELPAPADVYAWLKSVPSHRHAGGAILVDCDAPEAAPPLPKNAEGERPKAGAACAVARSRAPRGRVAVCALP